MVQRYPSAQNFANSSARMCLQMRWNGRLVAVEISSLHAMVLCGFVAALLAIYLVASCYFVFRDDMLARLLSNQAETQYAYEDRIAALRAHLDRVATKQLINQDSFEDKVNELMTRQSQLETRQAIVTTLSSEAQRQGMARTNPLPTVSVRPASPAGLAAPTERPRPSTELPQKTSFLSDSLDLRLGDAPPSTPRVVTPDALGGIGSGLARIEQTQIATLGELQRQAAGKLGRWRLVMADIGLDQNRFAAGAKAQSADTGGPFVPLAQKNSANPFDQSVLRLQFTLGETARMSSAFNAIPLTKPLLGEPAITSSFGARSDPFFHSAALHTGIDFRGGYGSPVRSTAPGKVVVAGPQGGYGNMVEIDHGFGLTTRYAHLSSIEVDLGDTVKMGDVVGHIGSTGRSTGPHLHYETRIDGDPVDPMRFLQAAARLGTVAQP